MRVLVCDDHSLFREGLRLLLEKLDASMEVTLTGSAEEAVAATKSGTFDLILMDWHMEGLSGARALEAPTLFSRLLAGAVTMIFFTYAFVNMGMVSGILPVVGVPLPFISYGGTAMVTLGMGLGILMSISKSKRLVQT